MPWLISCITGHVDFSTLWIVCQQHMWQFVRIICFMALWTVWLSLLGYLLSNIINVSMVHYFWRSDMVRMHFFYGTLHANKSKYTNVCNTCDQGDLEYFIILSTWQPFQNGKCISQNQAQAFFRFLFIHNAFISN